MALAAELKRRLDVDDEPLRKRLKLAENVISYPLFRAARTERVVLEWLAERIRSTDDPEELCDFTNSLHDCLKIIDFKTVPCDVKATLFEVVLRCLENVRSSKIKNDHGVTPIWECCLYLMERASSDYDSRQLIEIFLNFFNVYLNSVLHFQNTNSETTKKSYFNENILKKCLNIFKKYIKNTRRKSVLIHRVFDTGILWTFLDSSFKNEVCSNMCFNICQVILFPAQFIALLKKYILTLINGDDVAPLIKENGENIQSIIFVINNLLRCSELENESQFYRLLDLFKYAYRSDSVLIFLFNIFLYNKLGVDQDYIKSDENIPKMKVSKKFHKSAHLYNLRCLSKYNIDLNVKYTLNMKNEEKSFVILLEHLTKNILSEEIDDMSLQIVKQAFILEPNILKSVMEIILPSIMIIKKNDDNIKIYCETLITIFEIIFKISQYSDFLTTIIPALNEKLKGIAKKDDKIEMPSSDDIFPKPVCEKFGKLCSELVAWQHTNMMEILLKYMNEFFVSNMENENFNASDILIAESLSLLLTSFFNHSKIADQNIPDTMYKRFLGLYSTDIPIVLEKLSQCVLKYSKERKFIQIFLALCLSYGHLKLLLLRYQDHPLTDIVRDNKSKTKIKSNCVYNLTVLHTYIKKHHWEKIHNLLTTNNDDKSLDIMNSLIIQSSLAIKIESNDDSNTLQSNSKYPTYILNNIDSLISFISNNKQDLSLIISNMTQLSDVKLLSNKLFSEILRLDDIEKYELHTFFKFNSNFETQKLFLSAFSMECIRHIWIEMKDKSTLFWDLCELSESEDFEIKSVFDKVTDFDEFMSNIHEKSIMKVILKSKTVFRIVEILDLLPLQYLNEKIQLSVIVTVLILEINFSKNKNSNDNEEKLCSLKNKMKLIVIRIFELSYKIPNILNALPYTVFMTLIEKHFVMTDFHKSNSNFSLLYYFFQGVTNRNSSTYLCNLTKDLLRIFESKKEENVESYEWFLCNSFCVLCIFINVLLNIKKNTLSTEIKSVVVNSQDECVNVFTHVIKGVNSNNSNEEKKFLESSISGKGTINYILESYTLILEYHHKLPDVKPMKKLLKNIGIFITLALNILENDNSSFKDNKISCLLLNIVLKNYVMLCKSSIIKNQQEFFSQIWNSTKLYLKKSNSYKGNEWIAITNMILENTMLLFELIDVKYFNSFLTKELIDNNYLVSEQNSAHIETSYVIQKLWHCYLHANFKGTGKIESRSALIKKKIIHFFLWMKNMTNIIPISDRSVKDDDITLKFNSTNKVFSFEIFLINIETIIEFINTKRMMLSGSLIDIIIQLPYMINFETVLEKSKNEFLETFCITFEKCTQLLNALIINRLELLQDRWHSFFIVLRKLISILCVKSNADNLYNDIDIKKLVKQSHNIERITHAVVKNAKQDIARVAPYLVADIISSFQRVPVHTLVRLHLNNCLICFMQLLDNHSTSFLMRNMSDASRIIFQQTYDTYNKYHKYVGTS